MAGQGDLHGEITNWPAVERDIEAFPGDLADGMRSALQGVAEDAAEDARRRALSGPGGRGRRDWRPHHSRRDVAASIKVRDVDGGVEVSAGGSMPPGRAAFPFAYNQAGGWVHPVFGMRSAAPVHQAGANYMPVASRYANEGGQAVMAALDNAASKIKGK